MQFEKLFESFSSKFHLVIIASTAFAIIYILLGANDDTAYWQSLGLFIIGSMLSIQTSNNSNSNKIIKNLKEVIVGSINVGLKSIQRLEDNPPQEIAKNTHSNFKFMGIAGGKFLTESFDCIEFFTKNTDPKNIQIILMDPFSEDIIRLSKNKNECQKHRLRIIESLIFLNKARKEGYKFEIRLYPKIPPLRLMICDGNVTTLSVYTPDSSGWKNAQLIFDTEETPESLAPHFKSLFTELWVRGITINLAIRSDSLEGMLPRKNNEEHELAMVHGRFQPFHHEHLEYILWGITHSKKCIIAITQPHITDLSKTVGDRHRALPEGNPFTFEDRKLMIELSLASLGIKPEKYNIIPFDIDNMQVEAERLQSEYETLPVQLMKIFSGWEEHKKKQFEELGFKVEKITESNLKPKKNITGTLVRELIASDRNWSDFVPDGTVSVINNHSHPTKIPQIKPAGKVENVAL